VSANPPSSAGFCQWRDNPPLDGIAAIANGTLGRFPGVAVIAVDDALVVAAFLAFTVTVYGRPFTRPVNRYGNVRPEALTATAPLSPVEK